jgi:dTDP-4-amino-4,6-dideoxygalactose transaminase
MLMNYKIPLFDLNYGKLEENAVLEVLRSRWISMGEKTAAFESAFAQHLGVKHVIALNSGTAALHLAMLILGIGNNDEVIVPSLTFVATVNAVKSVGANPIFADITSFEDFSIDPDDVQTKITSRTRAIIVMHYGGFSCNMDKILNITKKNGIFVIEDAAHAPCSEYKGKRLGTIGNIGCFSFFSNKNLSCAEGGALVTNVGEQAKMVKLLRSHGMTTLSYERAKGHATGYDVLGLGFNYRIDDIRAALALVQLGKLKDDVQKRAQLRQYYVGELEETANAIVPYRNHLYGSSNYIFPVLLKDGNPLKRERIRMQMAVAGIQTSVHYPAVHRFSIYGKSKQKLPKTEYVADNEITLPLYYNLTKEDIHFICQKLKNSIEVEK